jgi:hypothetical protein
MMGPLEVLKDIVSKFEKANINYFLVGSLAAMYYSRPRFTNDIDLVVQLGPLDIHKFANLFTIEEYYSPPIEVLKDEVLRSGSFNLIHQTTGVKVDIILNKNTDFYKSENLRMKKVSILPGFDAFIASAEDIILKKLDFYREGGSEKHLLDIREILASNNVDQTYLDEWIQKMNFNQEWLKVLNT